MTNNENNKVINFIRKNKFKTILTILLVLVIILYFSQINWDIFFSNLPNLKMDNFLISTIFALGAFTTDAIIWYYFLKPLSPSEIGLKEIISLNYFSVMAGVVVPSGGAVDVAIKLKYVKDNSSLSYEEILATVLAVRIIFIITLYPTMALFAYILIQFSIVSVAMAVGIMLFSFLVLTLILGLLLLIVANVDFFNRILVNIIFTDLKLFLPGRNVTFLILIIIGFFLDLYLILSNILSPFDATILLIVFVLFLRLIFFSISRLNPEFYQKSFFSKKITIETLKNFELKIIKSSISLAVSFRLLKGSKRYWYWILFYTCIFWILRLLTMYYIFLVLRDYEFHVIIVTATIGSFTTMIPAFLPGMVGIRDIIVAETLTILSEITKEDSLLTSLMNQVQTLILFFISLIGFLLMRNRSKNTIYIETKKK